MHTWSLETGLHQVHRRVQYWSEVTNLPTRTLGQKSLSDDKQDTKDPLADMPFWLEDFTDCLKVPEMPAPANSSRDVYSEHPPKVVTKSMKHNVYTHFPKNWNCDVCLRTKNYTGPVQKTHWRSCTSCRKCWWLDNSRSQGSQRKLRISKQSSTCNRGAGLGHSMDPVLSVQNKKLIRKHKGACKSSWSQIRSLKSFTLTIPWNLAKPVKIFPGIIARLHHIRSETNGIAERAVRRVKEGISAVLLQSGLNESWWADSMECYTYLRNVTDLLSDGKNRIPKTFWRTFWKGPIIPFGSLVEYYLITAKDQSRIHQLGKKVLPGLFLGYALYAAGIWKGDVLVADLEELETMDAMEIYSKRLNAKEVIFHPKNGKLTLKSPLGEDALAKLNFVHKSLVTWQQQLTKSSMTIVNLKTITGTLSWYKILPFSGFNLVRAKQNLHMRQKKVCRKSWSRRTDRKLYIQTTRWNLGKHVKFYHEITALQNLVDPRQMASLKEPSEWKKAHQQCCGSQDRMKGGGQIPWNAIAICEMSKTS